MERLKHREWSFRSVTKKLGISEKLSVELLQAFLKTRRANLSSFWIHLMRPKIERLSLLDVNSQYKNDRFCRPSKVPQNQMVRVEMVAFKTFEDEYEAVEVSPVVPLGAYSALHDIDSSTYLQTDRMNSLVADPGYSLCAVAERARAKDNASAATSFCCSTRVMRAQRFRHEGLLPHFKMFGFYTRYKRTSPISDAQDACTRQIEKAVTFLRSTAEIHGVKPDFLLEISNTKLSAEAFSLEGLGVQDAARLNRTMDLNFASVEPNLEARLSENSAIAEALGSTALRRSEHLDTWAEELRIRLIGAHRISVVVRRFRASGIGYYDGLLWKLRVRTKDRDWIAVSDGGEVNWASRMSGVKSEASVVGGIGLESVFSALGKLQ